MLIPVCIRECDSKCKIYVMILAMSLDFGGGLLFHRIPQLCPQPLPLCDATEVKSCKSELLEGNIGWLHLSPSPIQIASA